MQRGAGPHRDPSIPAHGVPQRELASSLSNGEIDAEPSSTRAIMGSATVKSEPGASEENEPLSIGRPEASTKLPKEENKDGGPSDIPPKF